MKKATTKLLYLLISFFGISTQLNALTPQDVNYYPQTEEVYNFLNQMPWHFYTSHHVHNLGWFWVDSAKDCVKNEIKAGRIWEPYIINQIAKYVKKGDNVIDIGAHMGTITLAMSNLVGPEGKVYSFEGSIQIFRELVHNAFSNHRKNIFPHLVWIGDKTEDTRGPTSYDANYSPVSFHSDGTKEFELRKRTLDSFNFENIALMKIDVECTEDEVLRGAKQTIMKSRPVIIIEIMGGFGHNPTHATKQRIQTTINNLKEMNYTVSLIHIDDYLAIPNEKR